MNREKNLTPDDLSPQVPIELTQADMRVRDASNDFGLGTFHRLYARSKDGNVAFSPLSLSLALALAAEGAEGNTYKQFSDVIGWQASNKDEVGAYYQKMIAGLVEADQSVQFTSANSFWAATEFPLKTDYTSLLTRYFSAESHSVDFTQPATREQINKWCSDKTDGKIPQMLESLDPRTKLMLINALLFKAPWQFAWDIKQNRTFTTAAGAQVQKDYLYVADKTLPYGDFGDFELVRALYGNGAYTMDIILPKAGKTLTEILPELGSESINYGLKPSSVTLYLPKWSTDYSTEDALIPVLQDQGLTDPFNHLADFAGISSIPLYINLVLQKVRIDVTEKGTEFAAVTVVGMLENSAAPSTPPRVTVDVNRPFAYTIRESTSGTILLLGTLSK
jgi:serpin B